MRLTRDQIIRRFIETKRAEIVSPKTINSYEWALEYLPDPVYAGPEIIRQLYVEMHRCEGPCQHAQKIPRSPGQRDRECPGRLSVESLRDIDRVFRTFYRWAELERFAPNVMLKVRKPKGERRFPRTFNDQEIAAICGACEALRDQAMIGLALGTGLRIAELAGLKWADLGSGEVQAWGKGDKHRTIYFDAASPLPFKRPAPLGALLAQLRAGANGSPSPWVGPKGALTYDGCMQVFRRVVERARMQGKRTGPHTFRHTFAVLYLRAGGSLWALQKQMGHEDIQTTMLYARMVGRDVQNDVQKTRMFTVIRPDGSEQVYGERAG